MAAWETRARLNPTFVSKGKPRQPKWSAPLSELEKPSLPQVAATSSTSPKGLAFCCWALFGPLLCVKGIMRTSHTWKDGAETLRLCVFLLVFSQPPSNILQVQAHVPRFRGITPDPWEWEALARPEAPKDRIPRPKKFCGLGVSVVALGFFQPPALFWQICVGSLPDSGSQFLANARSFWRACLATPPPVWQLC